MAFGPFDRDESEAIAEVPPWPSGNDPPSDQPSSDGVDTAQEEFLFHLYRGSELLKDNQMLEAKEELEQALTLQPRDVKGQDLLAVVYFRLGLYPRAIHLYEQLRRLNPKDPALKLNLALCYLKTGQTAVAKTELEELVVVHPSHTRAWGYLGLAYERLADYVKAEHAYNVSGHDQRARRMADKLGRPPLPREEEREMPSREVREAVGAAAEELDAGGLSFALAAPTSDNTLATSGSWKSVELGQTQQRPSSSRAPALPVVGPGPDLSAPRRPTLVVAPPPAHLGLDANELAQLPSVGSPSLPAFDSISADIMPPSEPVRRSPSQAPHAPVNHAAEPPYVALYDDADKPPSAPPDAENQRPPSAPHVPAHAPSPAYAPPRSPAPPPARSPAPPRKLSSSSGHRAVSPSAPNVALSVANEAAESREPISIGIAAERGRLEFPDPGQVVIHAPNVALVKMRSESKSDGKLGFAVRLESVRAMSGGITTSLLERHARGRSLGESFGGIGSPVVEARGEGELVVGARPQCTLVNFALAEESCFLREDVVVAFDRLLEFDNGKLATGEGEYLSVVQFRGTGRLLSEVRGRVLTLEVTSGKSVHVRREGIVGWFGRLVPRALSASEAPSGQRGLVAFAGDGTVLLSA